jgi:cytochrome P450
VNAPPGHWLLGHVPALRRDPLGLLDACAPPAARLRLGRTCWLLLEPADVEHVLQTAASNYSKGQAFRYGRRLYGNSLLVSEGAEHQAQARLIGAAFFKHSAQGFLGPAVTASEALADRWQAGQRIDLWSAMLDLTLAVSSQAVFGPDWLPAWVPGGTPEADAILRAFDTAMGHVARQNFSMFALPDWFPSPAVRRYRRAVRLLDHAFARSLENRQTRSSSGGFLDALLAVRDEKGRPLPPQQVRDQALVFMLGGYESTATALCWALLLLGAHRGARQRLLDEVRARIGPRRAEPGDAATLPWTAAVFSESLRLYPPPWLIPRTAEKDDILPSGLRLKRGTLVFLSPYRTQRDERFFADPLTFDPGRWVAPRSWPEGAYFPFGLGPRHCIGESVARKQVPLILATLCRRWRFEAEGETLPRPRPLLTLRPPIPLWVRVLPAE